MRIRLILLSFFVMVLTVQTDKAIAATNIDLVQQERELLSSGDVVLREVTNGKREIRLSRPWALLKGLLATFTRFS